MEDIRSTVQRWIAQIFIWTLTAKSSAVGDGDAIESADDARDPGAPDHEAKSQRRVVRIQPFGFNSVPPTRLRALSLRLGMSNIFFIGIGPQKAYGPTEMTEGETAVYAKAGQTILLDKDGNVIATPAEAGTVQLGGDDYSLLKTEDLLTDLGNFAKVVAAIALSNVAAVGSPLAGTIVAPAADGAAETNAVELAALVAKLSNAALYTSTKAKNG